MAQEPPPPPVPSPYALVRPTESIAIAALVVGLVAPIGALFYGIPGVILGSIAVFLGLRARRRIKRSGGALAGGGMALAGWIVGLVGIVIGLVWFVFLFGLFMAMNATGDGAKGLPTT